VKYFIGNPILTMVGRLEGKTVVITGAGAGNLFNYWKKKIYFAIWYELTILGIGRASAILFAKEGAKVIATDLNGDSVKELLSTPGIVKALKLDILKKEDVQKVTKEVGRVDVLFNCAGWEYIKDI
jgi:NAD(P)-dependent dehydrogenase (short-subunit alcohol dehydrogenase family)